MPNDPRNLLCFYTFLFCGALLGPIRRYSVVLETPTVPHTSDIGGSRSRVNFEVKAILLLFIDSLRPSLFRSFLLVLMVPDSHAAIFPETFPFVYQDFSIGIAFRDEPRQFADTRFVLHPPNPFREADS